MARETIALDRTPLFAQPVAPKAPTFDFSRVEGMLLGLALIAQIFAKRHPSPARTLLVLSLGTVVGFVFGLLLMMGVGALQLLG